MFRDRLDAAEQLARRLGNLRGSRPLILAIPRGGVPMGRVVADALDGDLDVVLVRKIPAPGNAEYAIGAVAEDGTRYQAESAAARFGAEYVDRAAATQQEKLRERRARYTPVRPPIDPAGRIVVVVDDGSATGATMEAALQVVRRQAPKRLIAALGAAPPEVVRRLGKVSDEVICLEASADFFAVGQFFADFRQVDDEEVISLLASPPPRGPEGNRAP